MAFPTHHDNKKKINHLVPRTLVRLNWIKESNS